MVRIKRVASYICILQFIYSHLTGTLAANVSINQNITGLLGNADTDLTCSFFIEWDEQIYSVHIIAKNITEDVDDENTIAVFKPDRAAKLHSSGEYLSGRVTLINITNKSTNATLTFHTLKRIDEKYYMCKCYFTDKNEYINDVKSKATRILVKVPVRDVHINKQPNQRQYDGKTDNITLTCKGSGDPEPKYAWFKEANISNIISRTNLYVIEDIVPNNSGVYICEASNIINNVKYKHSNSVEIDIVDELLSSTKSLSSKISAVHAAYVVPLILAVGFIVTWLAVRKRCSNRCKIKKNKESCWQNMVDCFISCDGFTEKPDYTHVFRNNNSATKWESKDTSNGLKENKIICRNKEVDHVKTFDIIQYMPTASSNIYADPKDSLPAEIVEDRGKYEDNGASDQSAVYAEVIDQANRNNKIANSQTSVTPDTVAQNDHDIPEDHCHG